MDIEVMTRCGIDKQNIVNKITTIPLVALWFAPIWCVLAVALVVVCPGWFPSVYSSNTSSPAMDHTSWQRWHIESMIRTQYGQIGIEQPAGDLSDSEIRSIAYCYSLLWTAKQPFLLDFRSNPGWKQAMVMLLLQDQLDRSYYNGTGPKIDIRQPIPAEEVDRLWTPLNREYSVAGDS